MGRGSWVVGRGSWVVGRGSWVVGRGSEIPNIYRSCIHTFMLFQMPSRNSGFARDLFHVSICISSSHISIYTSYYIALVLLEFFG